MELDEKTDDVELVEAEIAQPTPTQGEIIDAKLVMPPKKQDSATPQKQKPTRPPASVPKTASSDTSSLLITIGLMLALCLGSSFVVGIGGFWLMLRQPVHVAGGPHPVDPKMEFNNRDFRFKEKIPKMIDRADPVKKELRPSPTEAPRTEVWPGKTDPPTTTAPPKTDGPFGKTDQPRKPAVVIIPPKLLTLDRNESIHVLDRYRSQLAGETIAGLNLIDSHIQVYRLSLEAGKRYNLLCTGTVISPSVRITNEGRLIAQTRKCTENASFISFVAAQNADHQVVVIRDRDSNDNDFSLELVREKSKPAQPVIVKGYSPVFVRDEIRLDDAADHKSTPPGMLNRDFTVAVKKDVNYKFRILDEKIQLACNFYFKGVRRFNAFNTKEPITWTFRSPEDGELRIAVYGPENPIGTFTLVVAGSDGEPTPEVVNLSLASPPKMMNGLYVTRLNLNRKITTKLVGSPSYDIAWMPDGRNFCFIDADGQLCRVRTSDMVLDRKMPVATDQLEMPSIVANQGGIFLQRHEKPECWILDAQTLELKKRLFERTVRVFSNPTQSTVLMHVRPSFNAENLLRYDLAKPESPPVMLQATLPINSIWSHSDLDSSGNHFLGLIQHGRKMARFSIEGNNLKHEVFPHDFDHTTLFKFLDVTPKKEIVIRNYKSDDRIKTPSGTSIQSARGYIGFTPDEPAQAIFALDPETLLDVVCKDPKHPNYYVLSASNGLIVTNKNGEMLRKINLLENFDDLFDLRSAIRVHPNGGKILVRIVDREQVHFFHVEIPSDVLTAKPIERLPMKKPEKTAPLPDELLDK